MTSLEIASKLAEITGKTANTFLNKEVTSVQQNYGDEKFCESASEVEVNEICNNANTTTSVVQVETIPSKFTLEEIEKYAKEYNGKVVNNFILHFKTLMPRKEYLTLSKGMSEDEALGHPLLYVMFRSIDQNEVSFINWLGRFKNE